MVSRLIAAMVAVVMGAGSPALAATIKPYDQGNLWNAAAISAGIPLFRVSETFDDGVIDGEYRRYNGLQLGEIVDFGLPFFSVSGGDGGIRPSGTGVGQEWAGAANGTRWNFALPVVAWGGSFMQLPNVPSEGLVLELFRGSKSLGWVGLPRAYTGFAGVVSDEYFDSLLITTTFGGLPPGRADVYSLDNMVAHVAAVPVPGALALLCTSIGGLALFSRRQRRHLVA